MTTKTRYDAFCEMLERAAMIHGFTAEDCRNIPFPYCDVLGAYDAGLGPTSLGDCIHAYIDVMNGRAGPRWLSEIMRANEGPIEAFAICYDDEPGYPLPTDRERFGGRA